MKHVVLAFSLVLIISGCNNITEQKISEEKAISIVLNDHKKANGKIKIISVNHKGNEYIIKWEIGENCEKGTDYVNDQSGEITKGEVRIC